MLITTIAFWEFTNQLYLKKTKTTAGQYLVISAYSITSQKVGIQLLSDGNNINI